MNRLAALLLIISLAIAGCTAKVNDACNAAQVPAQAAAVEDGTSVVPQECPAPSAPGELDLDDYDDIDADDKAQSDPLEGWNRFWFRFNDCFIQYVLKPLHKGYCFIVPEPVRSAVSTFSYNALFPVRMINSMLQGEFAQAGVEFDRSFVNFMLTLGFGDPASEKKPLFPYHPETENFDWTLARWGVADGPYFIIPFLGPSTVRGAVGTAGDMAMKPQSYFLDWPVNVGSSLYLNFNGADELYKAYDAITESALEPYIALRNGYIDLRRKQFAR